MTFYFLFSTLILSISAFSQLNPKTKWGEVSQAEIDYKEVSFEKVAPAVILYEEGNTDISGSFQTHVYRRIKILNEQGIEAANQQWVYYAYKGSESFGSIKAQTINIENGKPVIDEVDRKSIFETNLNEYYNAKKFTFPNVKVGSIIEFEYNFTDQKLSFIDAWRFQHEFPTLYSSYRIENNMGLDYTSLMIGDKIVEASKNKKDPDSWILKNLSSYTSLNFLYNKEDMAERIVFQLRGYTSSNGIFGTTNSYKDVLPDWKKLIEEMNDRYKGLSSKSVGEEIAAQIPDGKDEKETLQNLYAYFKNNFKWNNFYGIWPKQSNRETAKEKTGNSTDLNLLLNSVLKAKGFDSKIVLLSSRDNGKLVISYPYLGQFNYAVNLVVLNDNSTYLIDASNMKLDLGFAPLKIYNHYGLLVEPEKQDFLAMNQIVSEFYSVQNFVMKDGVFRLIRTDKQNGYFKGKPEDLPKGISEYSPVKNVLDIALNEKSRDTKEADDSDFKLTRISYESAPIENAGFIPVENPIKNVISEFKFEEKQRERALEFNFPFYYKTDAVIEIPEGFSADIPDNFTSNLNAEANKLIYFQQAEIKENKLILHVEFYLGKGTFTENYSGIKSFFEKANLEAAKSILLKKN
jgi:hypothetical protein